MDAGRAIETRLGRVREACATAGIDSLCVRDTSNIVWATGFEGVFDEERAHALLVTPQAACLHTDSRYSAACRAAAAGTGLQVGDARGADGKAVSHADWLAGQQTGARVGIEDTVTLAEYRKLQAAFAPDVNSDAAETGEHADALLADAAGHLATGEVDMPAADGADAAADCVMRVYAHSRRLVETSNLVLGLREIKDDFELERLRAAQAIADDAFRHLIDVAAPGMTEKQVQLELDAYMLAHGADAVSFPTIVATGANGANPHAQPTDAPLEAGQCVVVDFGARARNYCSDTTRMLFVGQPDARLRDAYQVLREANEQVSAMLKPGVTGAAAHQLAEDILAAGGFAGKMGHGLGHGVGIDVHEEPVLAPRNTTPLAAGNVVTVEPGIYMAGQFGMRLEDCGVIDQAGYHPFSTLSHDMVVL